jgi:hypothetical protein
LDVASATSDGVAAPRRKPAAEDFGYLAEGDLALSLRGVQQRTDRHGQPVERDLRDQALLALLSLQALRTVAGSATQVPPAT